MLRPLNSYSSPIWGTAAKTLGKELEILQNKTARRIGNTPSFLRKKDIQKDIQQKSAKDYHKKHFKNFFEKLEINDNSSFRETAECSQNNPKTIRIIATNPSKANCRNTLA
ncbi:hypothetical protein AVEN_135322-1 [Araneus ventricosus]|uniref:Uncharacterized protein n=1 Tax=Araneus ventricosus TaxID=182803 RepID=A0A4Y2KRK5_ARAVE|nr:hypothetical protein AVEN_135322-1 [Araneus ventricosus]